MFRSEGYIRLDNVHMAFDFSNLEELERTALRGKVKQSLLWKKRFREFCPREQEEIGSVSILTKADLDTPKIDAHYSDYPKVLMPSLEEAEREISDSDVSILELRDRCSSAFTRFCSKCSLFLCGPDGTVTPVDGSVMNLHYIPLKSETFTETSATQRYGEFVRIPPNQGLPWSFVDTTHFSIDCRDKLREFWEARDELNERSGGPIPETQLFRLQYLAKLAPLAQRLLPLEGHVLVIPENEAPDRKSIRMHLGIALDSDSTKHSGRPPKKHRAAEAYKELFPNGHEGKTRKQVLRQIEKHSGVRVAWSTLEQGLRGTPKA